MKNVKMILMLAVLLMLFACSNSTDKDKEASANQNPDETAEVQAENTDETAGEGEQTSTENTTEQENESDSTADGENESTNSNESNQDEQTAELTGPLTIEQVRDILLQSSEAMGGLTSMKLSGEINSDQTNRYQSSSISWNVDFEMRLPGKMVKHGFITVEDQRADPMELEVYTTPEMYWTRNLNHMPDQWTSMEAFMGGYHHYNILNPTLLHRLSDYASQFEGTDEGDHYQFEFIGVDSEFALLIYRGFGYMPDGVLDRNWERMNMAGTFEITIDKETLLVTSYTMTHDATVSDQEVGDYHVVEEAIYNLSHFNEYNDLTVPVEMAENAVAQ